MRLPFVSREAYDERGRALEAMRRQCADLDARIAGLTATIASMVSDGARAMRVPTPTGDTVPLVPEPTPEFAGEIEEALRLAGLQFGPGAVPSMRQWVRDAIREGMSDGDITHRLLNGEPEDEG